VRARAHAHFFRRAYSVKLPFPEIVFSPYVRAVTQKTVCRWRARAPLSVISNRRFGKTIFRNRFPQTVERPTLRDRGGKRAAFSDVRAREIGFTRRDRWSLVKLGVQRPRPCPKTEYVDHLS